MLGLMLLRPRRPYGAIDCRRPRYPQKITEDRRICDPASRRVCPCQLVAEWPRSTSVGLTDAAYTTRVMPPFPGSTRSCTAWTQYYRYGTSRKRECVARLRQYFRPCSVCSPYASIGTTWNLSNFSGMQMNHVIAVTEPHDFPIACL